MIDKLEFLLALAREQHFGRAAEACGVTQPTLSAGIKQLEEQIGVLLVNRGSRFQGFTPEGERVLDWARRIVGDTPRHAPGDQCAAARARRPAAHRRDPDRAGHGGGAHHALPRAASRMCSFTICSRTSIEMLELLENLEIDAGITYLDNEPLGRVNTVPLYQRALSAAHLRRRAARQPRAASPGPRSRRCRSACSRPTCRTGASSTRLLREAGGESRPTLESDSMIVLFSHVRTGRWASVMPAKLAETLGPDRTIRAIPIVEPEAVHTIGLVVPAREPMTPLTAALVAEARRIAATLDE